jgi:MFS family permease
MHALTSTLRRLDPGRVLFPLGLGTALSLMGDATLYTVLPTHTADAGITLAGVGVILGINRAIRLLSNGPTGLAYDRMARRRIFVPALFLGALSTAIYAATRGFWPLFIGRLLWGLAWSGIWVGGATMIMDVTTTRDRGRWTGLYQTWFFLGTSLGSLAGGFLTDWLGYALAMWIGALVTLMGAIAALALLPETQNAHPHEISKTVSTAGPLRANGALWAAVSLQGINRFVVSGVLSATLALVVQQQLQGTSLALRVATVTGILMASRNIFSMVAAPVCGVLSDRLHSRWLVTSWMVVIGIAGVMLMIWGDVVGLLAGVALTAISGGGIQSLATTLTGDLVSREQRGRAIGLLQTSNDLGSAIGPPLAYALMGVIALSGVYVLCAILFGVGLGLSVYYMRPRAS